MKPLARALGNAILRSFRSNHTEKLCNGHRVRRFQNIANAARRKLVILNAATSLNDLSVIPGNRLEALAADRQGQYSIRINDQYRICFRWSGNHAEDVEIVDYH